MSCFMCLCWVMYTLISGAKICNAVCFYNVYLQESYIRDAIGSHLLSYSLMPAHAVSCLYCFLHLNIL